MNITSLFSYGCFPIYIDHFPFFLISLLSNVRLQLDISVLCGTVHGLKFYPTGLLTDQPVSQVLAEYVRCRVRHKIQLFTHSNSTSQSNSIVLILQAPIPTYDVMRANYCLPVAFTVIIGTKHWYQESQILQKELLTDLLGRNIIFFTLEYNLLLGIGTLLSLLFQNVDIYIFQISLKRQSKANHLLKAYKDQQKHLKLMNNYIPIFSI